MTRKLKCLYGTTYKQVLTIFILHNKEKLLVTLLNLQNKLFRIHVDLPKKMGQYTVWNKNQSQS